MNLTELQDLIAMLRHMIEGSPYLNETKKSIIRQKLDDIQSTIQKENMI